MTFSDIVTELRLTACSFFMKVEGFQWGGLYFSQFSLINETPLNTMLEQSSADCASTRASIQKEDF